jgi:hypothetical protein
MAEKERQQENKLTKRDTQSTQDVAVIETGSGVGSNGSEDLAIFTTNQSREDSAAATPEVKPGQSPNEDRAGERRFRQTDLPSHFIERRRRPVISTEPPLPPPPPRFEDYGSIIGQPELDEIRFLARHLETKKVKMVNSTALGGGVAEILNRLVPLLNELDIHARWEIITGGNDFFEVTRGFHNLALPRRPFQSEPGCVEFSQADGGAI